MTDELASVIPASFELDLASGSDPGSGDGLAEVVRLVEDGKGHDLSLYRPRLVLRRLKRRARERRMGGLADYIGVLRDDPGELDVVFPRLLGRASRFFQSPSQLAVLQSMVLEPLCRRGSADEPVRAWIAGCSTGEEAYSIAVLLLEAMSCLQVARPIQILASDIDRDGVEWARRGLYGPGFARAISAGRRNRFFVREGTGFRVHEDVRERIQFSVRDPVLGPPSAGLDLVVCRNVLGALRPAPRGDLLSRVHAALKPGGCLLLGAADARPALPFFEALDARHRLFARVVRGSRALEVDAPAGAEDPRAAETILVRSHELVSSVSHELRTPLHAIIGYADLLGEEISDSLSKEQAGFLGGIRRSAGELLELVNTVLDLGRFEPADSCRHLERISVASFVDDIIEEIEAGGGRAGPRIRSRLAPDLPVLRSDPLKLKVALKNLIGNAVKYGRLDIQVYVGGADGGLEFWVTDRGPGISVEDQSHIFEAFQQGASATREELEGVGLGLYVTRKVIESLGGTIRVESRPGFGSIFRVWLPSEIESPLEPGLSGRD